MSWSRMKPGGCDALDVAAMWPSSGQVAAFPVPEIETGPERSEELPFRHRHARFW